MSSTVEDLEAQTAQVRADLSRTLDELTERLESGARTAGKVALAIGASVAVAAVAAMIWRRRH